MIEPCYRYRARMVRVLDGDTFDLRIDLGFRVEARVLVRLRGMNAPERSTAAGADAAAFVRTILEDEPLVVESFKDRRSFERWVADVYVTGRSLVDVMVEYGHGTRV